jgi:hypothetical protein
MEPMTFSLCTAAFLMVVATSPSHLCLARYAEICCSSVNLQGAQERGRIEDMPRRARLDSTGVLRHLASDERILGRGELLERHMEEVKKREILRLRGEIRSLDALCHGIAQDDRLTEMELRSGGISRKVRRAAVLSRVPRDGEKGIPRCRGGSISWGDRPGGGSSGQNGETQVKTQGSISSIRNSVP